MLGIKGLDERYSSGQRRLAPFWPWCAAFRHFALMKMWMHIRIENRIGTQSTRHPALRVVVQILETAEG
jgi:aminoglycoside phosphotransferase (APT) family kinase protein